MMTDIKQNNGIKKGEKNEEAEVMLSNGDTSQNKSQRDSAADDTKGLPIDRGWAWVVLAAAILYFFLFGGVRKNFGIFFVAFQKKFNSSASLTSLLTTVQSIIISVSSLFVMTIGMHYLNCRKCIMIGGVLIATANIITALSTDIGILFASHGVIEGIGISMVHPPVTSMIGEYFNKKRGMANALAFSGASLGNLVFAPIMTALFDSYGYTGTMFVVAGMTLNTCVAGALMRPIENFKKRLQPKLHPEKSIDKEEDSHLINKKPMNTKIALNSKEFSSLEIIPVKVTELKNNHGQLFRMHSYDPSREPSESPLVTRQRAWSSAVKSQSPRHRTFSDHSHPGHIHNFIESLSKSNVTLYTSTAGFYGSVVDVRETVERTLSKTGEPEIGTESSCCYSCKNSAIKVFKLLFDLSLFRNPVFPLFLLMAIVTVAGTGVSIILVAPRAKDLGFSSEQIGILVSLVGCFDLVGRVSLAVLSDRKFIKRTTIIVLSSGFVGLTSQFLSFFTTFEAMIVFAIIVGSFCGLYQALYAVILVDYLTLPKLKSCLGFTTLCHGIGMSVFFPLAGLIRDNTGTYVNSYHMLGCLLLTGAFIALCLPYVHERHLKKKDKEEIMC